MTEQPRTTRREMEAQLMERATKDDTFRQLLVSDPKSVLERELGIKVPASVNVQVLEESPTSVYLVMPPKPSGEKQELSDAELARASGGWGEDGWFDNTLSLVSPCTIASCFC